MRTSSVRVLILLTLLVYHLAATATEATTKQRRGAISKASCFPLMMSKRLSVIEPAMMTTRQLLSSQHNERFSAESSRRGSVAAGTGGIVIGPPLRERLDADKAK